MIARLGLSLDQVAARAHGQRLFEPLSMTIAPGEIATIMGPSGSGKSSVLAIICGTLDPALGAEGRVLLDGRPLDGLPPEHRRVGILFQDDLLFPHLSVGENLMFGVPQTIGARNERRRRAAAALAEADLDGFFDRDPATLSGGQRARIAVLRTLLAEPGALLLDEPFSKLDVALRARFRAFVFEHARIRQLPTLLVTHDAEDARAAGGTVVTLKSLTPEGVPNG